MILLLGCSEFVLTPPPPVDVADPPPDDPDADFGEPPDWSTCQEGWFGQYYNLPAEDVALQTDYGGMGWWDDADLAFRREDRSLDMGTNWWPVDEGFEGDPGYFSGRWTAWMRVEDGGSLEVVLGADTVAWFSLNREVVARVEGEAQVIDVPVSPGQFPIELRFGQQGDVSGLRFRVASGSAVICYPAF